MMAEEYRVVIYKVDTPAYRDSEETRYKIVAYDAITSKRVAYVYHEDPEKGMKRLRKRLPYDAKVTVERGY
jgi:hypothetical protein